MLENSLWSHPSDGVYNDSHYSDYDKQALRLGSNDTTINSSYFENSNMDPVANGICANNSIDSATCNNHNLYANDSEENESNDLLYVGWPDTVTLEDASDMLRSFESTFGCGEFANEDDFSWLSSQCIDGSDAVSFEFSTMEYPSNDDKSMIINNNNKQTKIHKQSETNGVTTLTSPCVNEFSDISNGVADMDNYFDFSFEDPFKNHCGYFNDPDRMDATSCDPNSSSTQVCCSEVENCGEVNETRKMNTLNLDSSNVPETSCLSFELDVNSLEASRLYQLQQVMHQLDTRTKLCIRDGLYRLARSAYRRNSSTSTNGRSTDDEDTNGIEGTKELMDIETDTNPLDRSIAHLLFHRPADLSANSSCDGSSLKTHTLVDVFHQ